MQNKNPAMHQKIFELSLSVEAISVYILCCSLKDSDTSISTKKLLAIWNGSEEKLVRALYNLEARNILQLIISDQKENNVYLLTDVNTWKP